MIRDPSDGSEYDLPDVQMTEKNAYANRSVNKNSGLLLTSTSGLQTGSQKPENLERLEKSREWLKQYRERKSSLALQAE